MVRRQKTVHTGGGSTWSPSNIDNQEDKKQGRMTRCGADPNFFLFLDLLLGFDEQTTALCR
jgi:hypothetical protein